MSFRPNKLNIYAIETQLARLYFVRVKRSVEKSFPSLVFMKLWNSHTFDELLNEYKNKNNNNVWNNNNVITANRPTVSINFEFWYDICITCYFWVSRTWTMYSSMQVLNILNWISPIPNSWTKRNGTRRNEKKRRKKTVSVNRSKYMHMQKCGYW